MIPKLKCRYCKIVFECKTWEQVKMIQIEQCYITRKGIPHNLKGVINDDESS